MKKKPAEPKKVPLTAKGLLKGAILHEALKVAKATSKKDKT